MSEEYIVHEMAANESRKTNPSIPLSSAGRKASSERGAKLTGSAPKETKPTTNPYTIRKTVYRKVKYVQQQDKTSL